MKLIAVLLFSMICGPLIWAGDNKIPFIDEKTTAVMYIYSLDSYTRMPISEQFLKNNFFLKVVFSSESLTANKNTLTELLRNSTDNPNDDIRILVEWFSEDRMVTKYHISSMVTDRTKIRQLINELLTGFLLWPSPNFIQPYP